MDYLTFDSATSAVECSIAIQKSTKEIDGLNLRIGIHEGEVIKQDGDVLGDDVNVAARIEPFSAEGGVTISIKFIEQFQLIKNLKQSLLAHLNLKVLLKKLRFIALYDYQRLIFLRYQLNLN